MMKQPPGAVIDLKCSLVLQADDEICEEMREDSVMPEGQSINDL
jgi:hypothetical protein